MQATPQNQETEAQATPQRVARGKSAAFLILLLGALVGGAFVLGVQSFVVLPKTPKLAQSTPAAAAAKPKAPEPAAKPESAAPVAPEPPAVTLATISGSVADEFGRSIAGAAVFVGAAPPQPTRTAQGSLGELGVTSGPVPAIPALPVVEPPEDARTAMSDQDGKFTVSFEPAGLSQLFVTQVGYDPYLRTLDNLRAGETRDGLYLVLRSLGELPFVQPLAESAASADPSLARIEGIVLDNLGHPVAGAAVRTDEGESSAQADGQGSFRLLGVAPGVLRVVAEDPQAGHGESREVRARQGETLEGVRVHLPGRRAEPPAQGIAAAKAPPWPAVKARAKTPRATVHAGVSLEDRPNGVVVSLVDPASTPARAGLSAGDALLRVDNEAVLTAAQGRGMLRDPAGTLARVQVKRGAKRVRLKWKRPGDRYSAALK